jgi:hypothetical protein
LPAPARHRGAIPAAAPVSPLRREASRRMPPSAVTAPLPLQPSQIFAAQSVPAKPPLFPPKSALSSHPATLAARSPALLQRIGLGQHTAGDSTWLNARRTRADAREQKEQAERQAAEDAEKASARASAAGDSCGAVASRPAAVPERSRTSRRLTPPRPPRPARRRPPARTRRRSNWTSTVCRSPPAAARNTPARTDKSAGSWSGSASSCICLSIRATKSPWRTRSARRKPATTKSCRAWWTKPWATSPRRASRRWLTTRRPTTANSNIVYDEAGTLHCYDRASAPVVRHRMSYIGHEPSRGTLKYRCPARHEDWACPMSPQCNAGKTYGLTVRVKQEMPRCWPACRGARGRRARCV